LNLFKLLKLLVLISIWTSQIVGHAYAWDEILDLKGSKYRTELQFDQNSKNIRLKFKKVGAWGRMKIEGPLSIASPTEVDATLSHLESFMDRHVFSDELQERIRNRLHEFKFISARECSALHFNLSGATIEQGTINNLLEQVEKIRLASSPGTNAFRSLLVREFTTTDDDKIQLRMVLDKNGDFLKFSFAKEQGTLVNYDWSEVGKTIVLKNPSGKVIIELDLKDFAKEGGLVTVRHPEEMGIEQEVRSFFRFLKSNKATNEEEGETPWAIYPYTTRHFKETVIRDGIALTSGVAEHAPIIEIRGSEISYPRMDLETYGSQHFLSLLSSMAKIKAEDFYNHCMGERLSFYFEEEKLGFGNNENVDENQVKLCHRIAELESIRLFLSEEKEKLGLHIGEFAFSETKLVSQLRTCLEGSGITKKEANFFRYSSSKLINIAQEEFNDIGKACYRSSLEELLEEKMREVVFTSEDVLEYIPSDRGRELLWSTVKADLRTNCLNQLDVEKVNLCQDYARLAIQENLFLSQVSHRLSLKFTDQPIEYAKERLRVIDSFESCRMESLSKVKERMKESDFNSQDISNVQAKDIECAKDSLLLLKERSWEHTVHEGLRRAGLLSETYETLSTELLQRTKELFSECISERIIDEPELGGLLSRLDLYSESCLPQGIKEIVEERVFKEFKPLFSKVDFNFTSDQENKLDSDVKNLIRRELENWSEIESLGGLKENLYKDIYGLLLSHHIKASIENEFDKESEVFDEAKDNIEENLGRLLGDNSGRPLALKSVGFFRELERKGSQGTTDKKEHFRIALREILKEFHKEKAPWLTVSKIGERVLITAEREEMAARVDSKYKSCIEDFNPNGSLAFSRTYVSCEKQRLAGISLEIARKNLQERVSRSFPLTSVKANRALAPIQYLELCHEKVDIYGNKSLEEYQKLIDGCYRVAELDVSYNLSLAKVDGYRPLLSQKGHHDVVTAYCYNILFNQVSQRASNNLMAKSQDFTGDYRDLSKMQTDQRSRNIDGASLLSYLSDSNVGAEEYAESDLKNVLGLINTFAANESLSSDWWADKLAHCEKGTDDFVMTSFREFVIESIPSLNFGNGDDQNTVLMRNFLDLELVELILKFKKAEARKTSGFADLGSLIPGERLVTPDLGVTALTNFIEILGAFLDRGFIYDEESMRSELVIFQSELKSFLSWSLSSPENISIREARDFFSESKLAEHLALAVVSELSQNQFKVGIGNLKRDELAKFYQDAGCRDQTESCLSRYELRELNKITLKYEKLEALAKEMTSSYDFRRIIRPESNEGEELISLIKETYLMPKILGQAVTAAAEEEMMKGIGDAIMRDNTDGGFAERFVEEVAQFELEKEKNKRWGITKSLFFDSGDFDWEHLRVTESGQKALQYYTRYILLPQYLGRHQSQTTLRIRSEQFRRLLTQAQGENDN